MKTILLGACAALGLGVVAQDPFEDATVEVQAVDGAVHMLTGYGGNIGLSVGEDGVLVAVADGAHSDGQPAASWADAQAAMAVCGEIEEDLELAVSAQDVGSLAI